MEAVLNRNILIIEDDDKLRFNLERMVRSLGQKLLGSFSDAAAYYDQIVEKLKDADLLLLDVNLPGKFNGVEFARKIKDEFKIPVLYITGNVEEKTFLNAADSLIYGYLPKPFSKVQLDFSMKTCLLRYKLEKEAENRLKKIQKKEKLIQIGEFAGGFVHDLNNFNSLILYSLHLIKNLAQPKKEKTMQDIYEFAEKGELGSVKIKQLSERYRKIILNQGDKEIIDIVIDELFDDITRFFAHKMAENEIKLLKDVPENLSLRTCEIILLQCLVNLISNSIYEIIDKECSERWIQMKAYSSEGMNHFEVSDSGPGIEKEALDEIFNFGYTTKTGSKEEGSGVGLSFVKASVEKELEGEIRLLEDREHTTFKISIPSLED